MINSDATSNASDADESTANNQTTENTSTRQTSSSQTSSGHTASINNPANKRKKKDPSRFTPYVIGAGLLILLIMLLLWRYIFVTILPGHVGVLYSWFFGGTRVSAVYGEGLVLKFPWNRIYIFETRIQERNDEVLALSAEGMEVKVNLSTLFHVLPDNVGNLLKEVGPEYEQRIVHPVSTGAVRKVIARYNSVELYTVSYDALEKEIHETVEGFGYGHVLNFRDLIIRKIILPPQIAQAIDLKLAQEQKAASYIFRLETARQEAEMKRIQALGIQNFYAIVSDALNKNLLTWRGIEATVELARSPNSKIVIVGSGEKQLPLILGSDIHKLPSPPQVSALTEKQVPLVNADRLPELFEENNSTTLGLPDSAMGVMGSGQHPKNQGPTNQNLKNNSQQENNNQNKSRNSRDNNNSDEARNSDGSFKQNNQSEKNNRSEKRNNAESRDHGDREGLTTPREDGTGMTSPEYKHTGMRKQPLNFFNRATPESSPYGIREKDNK